jgi:hypothetical protein
MTDHDLERSLTAMLADGGDRAPAGSRSLVAQRVARTRQRPTWLVRPYGRGSAQRRSLVPVLAVLGLLLLGLLAAIAVGAGAWRVATPAPTLTIWDVGGSPEGVGVAGGSVWVGDQVVPRVLRLDPATGSIIEEVATIGRSCGPIAENDGEAWMPACMGQPFTRIATDTNTPRDGLAAWGLQYAFRDERAWVVRDMDLGELISFDLATQADLRSFPNVGDTGGTLGGPVFAGGNLWVARDTPGRVLRLDADTGTVEATIEVPGAGWLESAFGSLWVWTSDGWLLKLDPTTGAELGRVEVGGTIEMPAAMAAGTDAMWVVAGDKVSIVDGSTLAVRETIELPTVAPWIAVDGDVGYVTFKNEGQVARIEP